MSQRNARSSSAATISDARSAIGLAGWAMGRRVVRLRECRGRVLRRVALVVQSDQAGQGPEACLPQAIACESGADRRRGPALSSSQIQRFSTSLRLTESQSYVPVFDRHRTGWNRLAEKIRLESRPPTNSRSAADQRQGLKWLAVRRSRAGSGSNSGAGSRTPSGAGPPPALSSR